MFGIRRENAGTRLLRALHEEIAGADQAFLVGERNGGATIDRCECGLQARRAAHRRHHPIRRPCSRFDNSAFAGAAFGAGAGQGFLQLGEPARIRNGDKARVEFLRELGQSLHIAVAGQRLDPVALGRAAQQIHRAVADRAGGPENGDAAHD